MVYNKPQNVSCHCTPKCHSTAKILEFLLPVSEVDDLVEEECPAGGAGEPRGDELVPVGEEGVALRAREQPLPADVLQVDPTHLGSEAGGGRRLVGRLEGLFGVILRLLEMSGLFASSARLVFINFCVS